MTILISKVGSNKRTITTYKAENTFVKTLWTVTLDRHWSWLSWDDLPSSYPDMEFQYIGEHFIRVGSKDRGWAYYRIADSEKRIITPLLRKEAICNVCQESLPLLSFNHSLYCLEHYELLIATEKLVEHLQEAHKILQTHFRKYDVEFTRDFARLIEKLPMRLSDNIMMWGLAGILTNQGTDADRWGTK